jgi:uncharacterized protein
MLNYHQGESVRHGFSTISQIAKNQLVKLQNLSQLSQIAELSRRRLLAVNSPNHIADLHRHSMLDEPSTRSFEQKDEEDEDEDEAPPRRVMSARLPSSIAIHNEETTMLLNYDDHAMHDLLQNARVIAVVGHSDKPHRTSYQIAQYLRRAGYTVYPVNPEVEHIDGERSYPSLKDVPEPIDIVNVFRRSEFLPDVVDEAAAVGAKAVWSQMGVTSREAEQKADAAHLPLVMDACIKLEHRRLLA